MSSESQLHCVPRSGTAPRHLRSKSGSIPQPPFLEHFQVPFSCTKCKCVPVGWLDFCRRETLIGPLPLHQRDSQTLKCSLGGLSKKKIQVQSKQMIVKKQLNKYQQQQQNVKNYRNKHQIINHVEDVLGNGKCRTCLICCFCCRSLETDLLTSDTESDSCRRRTHLSSHCTGVET